MVAGRLARRCFARRSVGRRFVLLACALLLALGAFGAAALAAGAPGEIAYDGCISDDGSGGSCLDAPGSPLTGADAVAVSPDGRSVYVVSYTANSIAHLFASATGQLSYDACFNDDGSQGCTAIPGGPLGGANSVAVSPDGKSVYVTGGGLTANAVSHFFAAANGELSYDGCLSEDGSGGHCANVGSALDGPQAVAVSPSGNSVYLTANNGVVHLFAAPQGQLTFDGCISDDSTGGRCVDAPGTPLTAAHGVAVSPDGKSVYVASDQAGTVTHFFAAPQGQLTYDGCVSSSGSGGLCANAQSSALTGAHSVAVSPDGRSLYVVGTFDSAVAHLSAAPQGQLTYQNCVSTNGSGSCTDVPGSVLDNAWDLAVSPEGNRVYVSSLKGTLTTFSADSAGQLSYDSCLSQDGSAGLCTAQPGPAVQEPDGLAVNHAGTALYAAVPSANAVDHFFRPPPRPRRGAAAPAGRLDGRRRQRQHGQRWRRRRLDRVGDLRAQPQTHGDRGRRRRADRDHPVDQEPQGDADRLPAERRGDHHVHRRARNTRAPGDSRRPPPLPVADPPQPTRPPLHTTPHPGQLHPSGRRGTQHVPLQRPPRWQETGARQLPSWPHPTAGSP